MHALNILYPGNTNEQFHWYLWVPRWGYNANSSTYTQHQPIHQCLCISQPILLAYIHLYTHWHIPCCLRLSSKDRLVGLVVKASAARTEDPRFKSVGAGIFPGPSHTSDLKIGTPVATLPGAWSHRVSAGTGQPGVSILWVRWKVWSSTSISAWQHVKLSEQICPWDTLACCWDIKEPTKKQTQFKMITHPADASSKLAIMMMESYCTSFFKYRTNSVSGTQKGKTNKIHNHTTVCCHVRSNNHTVFSVFPLNQKYCHHDPSTRIFTYYFSFLRASRKESICAY